MFPYNHITTKIRELALIWYFKSDFRHPKFQLTQAFLVGHPVLGFPTLMGIPLFELPFSKGQLQRPTPWQVRFKSSQSSYKFYELNTTVNFILERKLPSLKKVKRFAPDQMASKKHSKNSYPGSFSLHSTSSLVSVIYES